MARERRRHEHHTKQHPKKHDRKHTGDKDAKNGQDTGDQQQQDQGGEALQVTQMPAAQQAGLNPQDYPDEAAAFGTGPAEAVQYHYSRQDQYTEQFAQEQIAAAQESATAGSAAIPGPGQVGVSRG